MFKHTPAKYVIRNSQINNISKVLSLDIENKTLVLRVKIQNVEKLKGLALRSCFNLGGVYKGATAICMFTRENEFLMYKAWFNPETNYVTEIIDDFYCKLIINLISVEEIREHENT
jgi:hypothetical protein